MGVTHNFPLKYATRGGYIAVWANLSTDKEQRGRIVSAVEEKGNGNGNGEG